MNIKFQRQVTPYINTVRAFKDMGQLKQYPNAKMKRRVISEDEKLFFAKAREIWKEYSQSEEGASQLELLKTMDLLAARKFLNGIFQDVFKSLKSLANKIGLSMPKSFSIALNVEIGLTVIGFSASIGVAFGLDGAHVESSEFIIIGVQEGFEVGAIVDVQFALWENSPKEIGGFFQTVEEDAGDGEGEGRLS